MFSRIFLAMAVIGLFAGALCGGGGPSPAENLCARHAALVTQIENNGHGLPIVIESVENHDNVDGDVYGIIEQDYRSVRRIAESPSAWCEIILLHLNVKTAVQRQDDGWNTITVYTDSKKYKCPEDAHRVDYRYEVAEAGPQYCLVTLLAPEAPMNTRSHRIEFEAMPIGEKQTFVHLSYSYEYGSLARGVITGYMNTRGRNKVGFSRDLSTGEYVGGIRGAIERNAVRYYFAIKAYMDTPGQPADQHFASSAAAWFDLSECHARQLHEIERADYLANKAKERHNQLEMQIGINAEADAKRVAVDKSSAKMPAVN